MSGSVVAVLYGWFAVTYVIFVATGGLPSELKPSRRLPGRVLLDRGAFFMAIFVVPSIALPLACGIHPDSLRLAAGSPLSWVPWTVLLSALAATIGFFSAKSDADRQNYPQYLPARWNAAAACLEVGSWALYLFAYEFAFRGYLLTALVPLGAPAAIAVNTALYAFAHLPKSGKEAAGALLLGVVLSLLTLAWGTIVPAFIIHLALALGNDAGALRAARISNSEHRP
ncbi:MAG TPA: CPBP family glutamic-type intramembrane protease [bacterium]|nr:CPBP family glutamic-type intramembrane protease [bacterium]